jgi:hypothetical protein
MLSYIVLVCTLLTVVVVAREDGPVTCGSMVKMKHVGSGSHLHSHQIQWGSGRFALTLILTSI